MTCKKCKSDMSDESKFCSQCGTALVSTKRPRRRRPNGSGSVYKTKSGHWQAEVVVGCLPNGRPDRRTKGGFEKMQDAFNYIPELRKQPRKNVSPVELRKAEDFSSYTFSQLYERWKTRHEKRVEKGTMGCYTSAYNNHFTYLYPVRFLDLNTEDFQLCIDDCAAGKRTRQNMKALGTLLYKYAYELGMTEKNYAQFIYIGKMETESRNSFSGDVLARILKAAQDGVPFADYVACMCYLGYRPTEQLDLTAEHYLPELDAFIGGMKTDAGKKRIVPISPKIKPFIETRLAAGTEFLFPNANGQHTNQSYFREFIFYPLLDKLGIQPLPEPNSDNRPTYTPYSCRHTFATLMKNVKGPDIDKASLMGHTSYEMTLKYQDKDIETLRRIVNEL